ncbi:MAG: hypothetical protein Q4D38_01055 [Planctomycetia bacterium]|nr:hypothetical protein [Planctomycetia bacterium]
MRQTRLSSLLKPFNHARSTCSDVVSWLLAIVCTLVSLLGQGGLHCFLQSPNSHCTCDCRCVAPQRNDAAAEREEPQLSREGSTQTIVGGICPVCQFFQTYHLFNDFSAIILAQTEFEFCAIDRQERPSYGVFSAYWGRAPPISLLS